MAKLVNSENLAKALQGVHGKAKTMVETEKAAREAADTALQTKVEALEGKFTGEGSVASQIEAAKQEALAAAAKAQEDAQKYADQKDATLKSDLQKEIDADVKVVSDQLASDKAELEGKITKAQQDAQGYADTQDAALKLDLEGQIADAKTDLEAYADQAEADAKSHADSKASAAETNAKGYADGIVATEAQAREAADAKLQEAINAINGADNGILAQAKAYTNEKVGEEATARQNGDADTLAQAKSYADGKITALVDSAPDTMNTLKELADAIAEHGDVVDGYVETINGNIAAAETAAKKYADDQDTALNTQIQKDIAAAVKEEADRAKAEEADIRSDFAAADTALHTTISAEIDADVKAEADRAKDAEQALQGEINGVAGRVGTLETKMTTAEGKISTVEGKVSTLEGKMTAAEGAIGALEAKDVELGNAITALEQKVGEENVADQVQDVQDALDQFINNQTAKDAEQDGAITQALADAKTYAEQKASAAQSAAEKHADDADAALKGELTGEIAKKADKTALEQEVKDRQTAVSGVQTNVDNLRSSVVNTFNALNLEFNEGQVRVILDSGSELGTSPLSGWVDVPVMTDAEVEAILAGLE